MTETRLYRVVDSDNVQNVRIVEATSYSQVLRHVAVPRYTIDIPKAKDVAALMAKGVKVEQAKPEPKSDNGFTEVKT